MFLQGAAEGNGIYGKVNANGFGERFVAWLRALPKGEATRIHILTDFDGDGLPAGALLARALREAGYAAVTVECRRKFESAWWPAVLERIAERRPEALIVADLGSRAAELLPGVPTVLIDHHKPLGVPPGAELISSYREMSEGEDAKSIETTGMLAYRCAQALLDGTLDKPGSLEDEEAASQARDAGHPDRSASKYLWLAAISLVSDLGDKAPFEELAAAKKQYGGGNLRDITSLLNAPRRSASGDASAALELLMLGDSPKQILTSADEPIVGLRAQLYAAKAEVAEALAAARKLPPRFSRKVRDELGADLVAIRMETPCQVHPLVAQQWRARFPKSVIFGVNVGYREGWVQFSGRAPAGVNLIEFLARHRPPEADYSYGVGHDQASGGALPNDVWNRFAAELGFGEEMMVRTGTTE